jgi:hypothetical protein
LCFSGEDILTKFGGNPPPISRLSFQTPCRGEAHILMTDFTAIYRMCWQSRVSCFQKHHWSETDWTVLWCCDGTGQSGGHSCVGRYSVRPEGTSWDQLGPVHCVWTKHRQITEKRRVEVEVAIARFTHNQRRRHATEVVTDRNGCIDRATGSTSSWKTDNTAVPLLIPTWYTIFIWIT